MNNALKLLIAPFVGLALLSPSLAAAEEEEAGFSTTATESSYAVEFGDDDLLGGELDSNIAILRVRPASTRLLLIRPRLHFVHELTKSVENF
jgi:hypothetical protein